MKNIYEDFAKHNLSTDFGDTLIYDEKEEKIRILMMKLNHSRKESEDIVNNGYFEEVLKDV